jgi:ATP-dependent helicase/nuclease subunit B
MNDPMLEAALRRGATVVTPNKRLARELLAAYDALQVAEGHASWPSGRACPWSTFVAGLVEAAQDDRLPMPAQRLDAAQSLHLWRRIVASDRERSPLVDADAAATLAADAWERLHAWGSGGESWRGFSHGGEDVEAFARWAEAYWKELGRLDAVDGARAADMVAAVAARVPGIAALDVVLAGFAEFSAQQQRLLGALEVAGARIERQSLDTRPIAASNARLVECETSRDELGCAIDWARAHALGDPAARIGIVVLDLAERRGEVRSACEERLCAPLQWPGYDDAVRPYDISVGIPLADVPLVASALSLITIAQRPIDRARAAVLVRSPYLPGSEADWMRRAALDRAWLEGGVREIAWPALVQALRRVDANLAARWEWASGELRRESRLAPRAWVERWREWLTDVGWCLDRTLSSDEFQADGAWNELLGTFVRLASVAPTLTADEALATLAKLAREQLFQPAASGANIRVLGLLEAAGLSFDALWVAGMGADAWPRSPDPSPLLPIAWQRERGLPRSSPQNELAFAKQLTAQLAHAAPDVVFSFAAAADDHRRSASPLIARLPRTVPAQPRPSTADRMFARRPALQSIADSRAPALVAGSRLPGGTGLIEAQSACPFRAVAVHRLGAQTWPGETLGLTPIERGKLVHATLDRFWRSVRTHARLVAMDDASVGRAVDEAFEEARASLPFARWSTLPPAIAATEGSCVSRLIGQWLAVERNRAPFEVADTERRATIELGGHTLELRLDRVDALAAGGAAVIDYKTGLASAPSWWFEPRPQALQVALYAQAIAQATPESDVRALVYAQLRPGAIKAVGLAEDASSWPGLAAASDVANAGLADWSDATTRLQESVERIVTAFAAG